MPTAAEIRAAILFAHEEKVRQAATATSEQERLAREQEGQRAQLAAQKQLEAMQKNEATFAYLQEVSQTYALREGLQALSDLIGGLGIIRRRPMSAKDGTVLLADELVLKTKNGRILVPSGKKEWVSYWVSHGEVGEWVYSQVDIMKPSNFMKLDDTLVLEISTSEPNGGVHLNFSTETYHLLERDQQPFFDRNIHGLETNKYLAYGSSCNINSPYDWGIPPGTASQDAINACFTAVYEYFHEKQSGK